MDEIEIHAEIEIEALTCSDSVDQAIKTFQANPTEYNRVRMIVAISEHAYDELGINVTLVGDADQGEENHDA